MQDAGDSDSGGLEKTAPSEVRGLIYAFFVGGGVAGRRRE